MPAADFFHRLGIFVVRDFCGPDLRAQLRAELLSARSRPATITNMGTLRVDENVRRTKSVRVSSVTVRLVEERLLALKPSVEKHFHLVLNECETPQFLVYGQGDFFQPHKDSNLDEKAADFVKARKVSVVLFLNGPRSGTETDSYCGGSLTFYGLIDGPRWKSFGFPLMGEPGMLVAFRSEILHEVEPITQGNRYTVVSWYL